MSYVEGLQQQLSKIVTCGSIYLYYTDDIARKYSFWGRLLRSEKIMVYPKTDNKQCRYPPTNAYLASNPGLPHSFFFAAVDFFHGYEKNCVEGLGSRLVCIIVLLAR